MTPRSEVAQDSFQFFEIPDLVPDVSDVPLGKVFHFIAREPVAPRQPQQNANLTERETELARAADKYEPPPMGIVIDAMSSVAARGFWEKADTLVVADGLDVDARDPGEGNSKRARSATDVLRSA